MIFEVRHNTTYRYRRAVTLNPHRLLLRPRDSYDLRVIKGELVCLPEARLTWATDVFGNSVALAVFDASCNELSISSRVVVEQCAPAWPVFTIDVSALTFPFNYSAGDTLDLGALLTSHYPDATERLRAWAMTFVHGAETDTLSLLKNLNAGVCANAHYDGREEEGVQHPLHTLQRAAGSCRDFAVFYVEVARAMGFGARLASGYLNPEPSLLGSSNLGSTHAWAEIYLPGAGWIAFDPTNHTMGSRHLIPVAVGRDICSLSPVSGGYVGDQGDFIDLTVRVTVMPCLSAS